MVREPERNKVERRVAEISSLLNTHAGGVELMDVTKSGTVKLRFTGQCTGCPLRPVTMIGTIRPGLLALDGVTAVEAEGARISAEAERRLAHYLSAYGATGVLSALEVDETSWGDLS